MVSTTILGVLDRSLRNCEATGVSDPILVKADFAPFHRFAEEGREYLLFSVDQSWSKESIHRYVILGRLTSDSRIYELVDPLKTPMDAILGSSVRWVPDYLPHGETHEQASEVG